MKRLVLNVAGLFVAIVAILFGLPNLYLMAAILWLIPAVSYLMGWLMLPGLTGERALPLSAALGEAIPVIYTLGNRSRLPKFYLLARDKLPPDIRFVPAPPPLILSLWPGREEQTRCQVEARRRGVFALGPIQVYSTDPLGLQTFSQKLPLVSELIVYPRLLPIRGSWLRGAAAQGWRGQSSALRRGMGEDFYGVREYQPGDALRHVHWRTTARTGVLAVTEYAQGVTLDVVVALDLAREAYAGTGEDEGGALECAVTLTATLLDDLLRHGHTVRLLTQASAPEDTLPAAGAAQMPRFMETLARAQAGPFPTLAETLAQARTTGEAAATLVVITPDFQHPRLTAFLEEWEAGGRWFGLALDAASFRAGLPGLPDSGLSNWGSASAVRVVRRGDNLQTVLEGGGYGWNGE